MLQYFLGGIILVGLVVILYRKAPSLEKEQAVLNVIRNNPDLHGTEIARRAKVSTGEVYQYLRILESKKMIQAIKRTISGLEVDIYRIM